MRQSSKTKNKAVSSVASEFVRMAMRRSSRNKVFTVIAVAVAAFTVFALAQPAVTLTYDCGMDEHVHAEECYISELVCDNQESGHEHTDACYSRQLSCATPEHVHSDECTAKEEDSQQGAVPGGADAPAGDEGAAEDPLINSDRADASAEANARAIPNSELVGKKFVLYAPRKDRVMTTRLDLIMGTDRLRSIVPYSKSDNAANGFELSLPQGAEVEWTFEENNGELYLAKTAAIPGKYLGVSDQSIKLAFTDNPATPIEVVGSDVNGDVQLRFTKPLYKCPITYQDISEAFDVGTPWNDSISLRLIPIEKVKFVSDIVDGLTPPGTVINMFDYWTGSNRSDTDGQDSDRRPEGGINKGHSLKFGNGTWGPGQGIDEINKYPGHNIIKKGIVDNLLDEGGYPKLVAKPSLVRDESLKYLFDPSVEAEGKKSFAGVYGLLRRHPDGSYIYNSKKEKDSTDPVNNDPYQGNFAELDESTGNITLHREPGVLHHGTGQSDGQFFPFNKYKDVKDLQANDNKLNHHFGMTLTTKFVQRYEGHTDIQKRKSMIFEFSGDDDVWIFIDGVLVSDLGGIRDRASVSIDFSTGEINEACGTGRNITNLRAQFKNAGKEGGVQWSSNGAGTTFADGTYHTLNFFYLERGAGDSNLKLKYNLISVPETKVEKVDQYGRPIAGAKFAVYPADAQHNYLSRVGGKLVDLSKVDYRFDEKTGNIVDAQSGNVLVPALYTGVTNGNGSMPFVESTGNASLTLSEMKSRFGEHFILRECGVPDGYRVTGEETHLKIDKSNLLLCENSYATGSYAAANLIVKAPAGIFIDDRYNTYKGEGPLAQGGPYKQVPFYDVETGEKNGTLFAVVMKYSGPDLKAGNLDELGNEYNWNPVYGTAAKGYRVLGVDSSVPRDLVKKSIEAAQKASHEEGGQVEFSAGDGAMQVNLVNLPGEIETYYYTLADGEKHNTKFSIGYYWTKGDLASATVDNTWPVSADQGVPAGNEGFTRVFGSNISVPNIVNRLLVQKRAESPMGLSINGAAFALYSVVEGDKEGDISYTGKAVDGTTASIKLSSDGTCSATVDGAGGYSYTIDAPGSSGPNAVAGRIHVGNGKKEFFIDPANNANGKQLVKVTATSNISGATEEGIASFEYMYPGKYALREVSAPAGFEVNPAESLVLVTRNAVYACAGTAEDGVRVGRGPGYIVDTMREYATDGEVNMTLQWIVTMLRVYNKTTPYSFKDFRGNAAEWKFLANEDGTPVEFDADANVMRKKAMRAYLKYKTGDVATDGNRYRSYTVDSLDEYKAHQNKETGLDKHYGDGVALRSQRLYTATGWSTLEVYQDWWYGQQLMKDKPNVVYENLVDDRGNPDLSRLFSRSVTVEFSDPRVKSNLKVSKVLEDASGAAGNPAFDFRFTLSPQAQQDPKAPAKTDVFACEKTDKNGAVTPLQVANGGTFALRGGESILIKGLPAGAQYKVEELTTGYTTSSTVDGGNKIDGADTGLHNLQWDPKTGDYTSEVVFTNAAAQPVDIVLRKTDASLSAPLGGAQFVLYREVAGQPREYFDPEWSADRLVWSKLGAGEHESKFQFALGEKAIYRLPNNAIYYLKELKAPDGHLALEGPVRFDVLNGKISNVYYRDAVQPNWVMVNSGSAIEVLRIPNSAGAVLPNAGGSGTAKFTVGGVALLAMTLMIGFVFKRSRGREDSA